MNTKAKATKYLGIPFTFVFAATVKLWGIVLGVGGWQNVIYVFLGVIPYGGGKCINKISPEKNILFMCVFLLFGSQIASIWVCLMRISLEKVNFVQQLGVHDNTMYAKLACLRSCLQLSSSEAVWGLLVHLSILIVL